MATTMLLVPLMLALARADIAVPSLPDRFTTRIEANIIQKNYTMFVDEVYDAPGQRAYVARDSYDGAKTHTLDLAAYGLRVTWEGHEGQADYPRACVGEPISRRSLTPTGHLRQTSEALAFGYNLTEHYVGRGVARGISTHVWRHEFSHPVSSGVLNYTLDYHFAAADRWAMRGVADGAAPTPVRAVLAGTSPWSGEFLHNYEYVHFLAGADAELLRPPAPTFGAEPFGAAPGHWNLSKLCNLTAFCTDAARAPSAAEACEGTGLGHRLPHGDDASWHDAATYVQQAAGGGGGADAEAIDSKVAVGLSFAGVFVGVLMGVMGTALVAHRKEARRPLGRGDCEMEAASALTLATSPKSDDTQQAHAQMI